MADMIRIEIVFAASADQQHRETMQVISGTTVMQAMQQSQLVMKQSDTVTMPKGIFGRRVTDGDVLNDGDRLEIYRPLLIDPMQKRKKRAGNLKKRHKKTG